MTDQISSSFSWQISVAIHWRRRSKTLNFVDESMNDTNVTVSSCDRTSVASESDNVESRRGRRIRCLYSWKMSSSLYLDNFCLLVTIYSVRHREKTTFVKADIDAGRTLIQTVLVDCLSFPTSGSITKLEYRYRKSVTCTQWSRYCRTSFTITWNASHFFWPVHVNLFRVLRRKVISFCDNCI